MREQVPPRGTHGYSRGTHNVPLWGTAVLEYSPRTPPCASRSPRARPHTQARPCPHASTHTHTHWLAWRGRSVSSTGSRSSCRTSRSDPTRGAALFSDTVAPMNHGRVGRSTVVPFVAEAKRAGGWSEVPLPDLGWPSSGPGPTVLTPRRGGRGECSVRTARGPPRMHGARADAGAPMGAGWCARSGASSGFNRAGLFPCAYSAQLYSVTLVPLGFHCPFVGLSVFHETETGNLSLFYEGRLYGAGGAVGPWRTMKSEWY
jgi:hypothetical protein